MRSAVRAEINVTPLVDVCLVLLIIFMVVTPLFNAVQLPDAPDPEPWGTEPARSKIILSYGPPVTVRVDDDPSALSDAGLSVLLGALHKTDPRREIALRADRRLPYGEVKRVLRNIQGAGFGSVGLVAERTLGNR